MTTKYNVYAEDMDGKRRFIAQAIADRGGNGLFDLYADECGDEEQIVIVPVAVTDAARALGSMTSPAKQASSRANGKRGGRPKSLTAEQAAELVPLDYLYSHTDGPARATDQWTRTAQGWIKEKTNKSITLVEVAKLLNQIWENASSD